MTTTEASAQPSTEGMSTPPSPRWRRPAVWIALWFAVGISLHSLAPRWAGGYCLSAAALAAIAIALARLRSMALVLMASSLLLSGLSLAQLHRYYASPTDVRHMVGEDALLARVRVRIMEPATLRTLDRRTIASARCELLGIQSAQGWPPIGGKAILRVADPTSAPLLPGQELTAIGSILRIGPPANPGEYDWQSHFAREGIFCRLSTSGDTVEVVSDAGESWLWRARRFVRDSLSTGFDENQQHERALLQTLLFGDNDELLEQTWADFRASGTAHHLSISGMHIATLCAAVFALARLLRLHPARAIAVAMVFAVCYGAMTRPSPPVIRSVLLCLAIGVAMLTARNTDPLQCLGVAVIAMLLINPLDLLNPGFQLSFATVAGLMICTPRVNRWFWSFENHHAQIARMIRPPTGFAAVRHRILRASVAAISAGLVAHAVSMPLIAWHFGQMNPWAIPGSLLLAVIVECSLVVALLKVIVCAAIPAAGPFLAACAAMPALLMTGCVSWLASLPGAQLSLGPVPLWLMALYALLFALPLVRARSRHLWISPVLAGVAFAAVMIFGLTTTVGRDVIITFLSVGNGSCAIVQMPDRSVVVDCGAIRRDDLYTKTIAPALRTLGVRHVDDVVITHEDTDHRSALNEIVAAHGSVVHRRLSRRSGIVAGLEVLAPSMWDDSAGNDGSAVLRLSAYGRTVLFTGDIQHDGIARLLASVGDLKSDVLVAPHHGSSEANTPRLLAAVRPRLIVCSSSSTTGRKQRNFDAMAGNSQLLRTGKGGAVTVRIDPQGNLDVHSFQSD